MCQQSKRAFNAKPLPLQPQAVDDVFGRWQMDILSGLPTTKDKYKHILVMVDSYSKWVELFPLRTQEASSYCDLSRGNKPVWSNEVNPERQSSKLHEQVSTSLSRDV